MQFHFVCLLDTHLPLYALIVSVAHISEAKSQQLNEFRFPTVLWPLFDSFFASRSLY